jgi:alpha-tubulin suppressor-like RCC1 family protein
MFMRGASHRLIAALCLLVSIIPPSVVSLPVSAKVDQASTAVLRATKVVTGFYHTCALTSEGTVMCWGDNEYGQLGDGTTTNRSAPVAVNGLSHVTALTAGDYHTCALTDGGLVACWGRNQEGQLGLGDAAPISSTTPLTVSAPLSNVVALSAGTDHTCAIVNAGNVMCWGENAHGQLGNETLAGSTIPTQVSELSNTVAIATGEQNTCAVLDTGDLKCWGVGWDNIPKQVDGVSNVAEVILGYALACIRTTVGEVDCWGRNEQGQLGDGTTTTRYTPGPVSGISNATVIVAGRYSVCALTGTHEMKCWGDNIAGQLGNGLTMDSSLPVDVLLSGDDPIAIDAGLYHACAVTSAGRVKCWGENPYGQLGNGRTDAQVTPVTISRPITDAVSLSAGLSGTCALTRNADVRCWGANFLGQLGDGTTSDRYIPVPVVGLSNVANIVPGWYHTCAATRSGSALCWGYNAAGQLGDGTSQTRLTPVVVSGLDTGVASVVAGFYHSCAVMQTGGVKCWGYNAYGELGDGTKTDSYVPVDVGGLTGVAAIATGPFSHHVCALASGHVKCWGENEFGQLGDGTRTNRPTPVQVNGLSNVTAVAVGTDHTCALLQTGKVKCWGSNQWGQMGNSTVLSSTTPLEVSSLSDVAAIAAGSDHTCALTHAGVVKCWGANWKGELGDGTLIRHSMPIAVSGLSGVMSIASGLVHVCALLNTGEIKCWGSSSSGSLGIDPGWTPVAVLGFGFDHTLYLPQMQHP